MLLQFKGFSREFVSLNMTCNLISSDGLWLFCCALFQMLGGYGDFLYQTGMIDELQRDYVDHQTSLGVKFIQQQKWLEAFEVNSYFIASTLLLSDILLPNSPSFGQILEIFVSATSFGSGCRFGSIFFLVSGLWQSDEWRHHISSLLLPERHRLQQLLQLLDVSGTVPAEIQTTCMTSLTVKNSL